MTQKPKAPPGRTAPVASPTGKKSPRATIQTAIPLSMKSGISKTADRIVVYGTGKIGKSTLCAYLPAPYFFDVEAGTKKLNVTYDVDLRAEPTWAMLRGKLASIAVDPPPGIRSIVIDTATVAEELAKEHVIETRKATRNTGAPISVDSIEGFGWGKGWQFVYDEFNGLLADIDRIVDRHGIHVCLIAHSCASPVPNPGGEDFIQWQPLLYGGDKKERGSIRARPQNWSEHILFVGYDVFVEEGKGQGSGTRTIFTQELPTHIAGSRTKQLAISFDLQDPGAVWRELGIS